MNERETPTPLPPVCPDCGHRASLHHLEGCRALLLGRGTGASTCGCATTLRASLGRRVPQPPAELVERA